MDFKFELNQVVKLKVSDEQGKVTARADSADGSKSIQVHYKDANGCAKTEWFNELLIEPI